LKKLMIIITLLLLSFSCFYTINSKKNDTKKISEIECYLTEDTEKLRYQDIFVTLLLPYVENAINNYYEKEYIVSPDYINIKSAKRIEGFRKFDFIIELEVIPYVSDYHIMGVDRITIKVCSDGSVAIEKYEHIKDYNN